MSEKKNRKASETEGERLDALLSALGEVAPNTEDDIDSYLGSIGYDLQELNKRSNSLLAKLLGESPEPRRSRDSREMKQPVQNECRRAAKKHYTREDNIVAIKALQIRYGEDLGANHGLQDIRRLHDGELEKIREELESRRSNEENRPPESK